TSVCRCSITALEVVRNDGALVDPRTQELVALVTLHLETELVALDLDKAGGYLDGGARRGRGEVPHMDLVSDRRVALRQQTFHGAVAGDLHQTDHGRR